MIRVCLIGAGDIKYHYSEMLKIDDAEFNQRLKDIGQALAESRVEIVICPDRGISFEVAKKYKQFNGRKVYGTMPLSDKEFGVKHLQHYLDAEINRKKVVDEIINTQNWYKQDLTHCLFGDAILLLGKSLGSLGELAYGYYLYKIFTSGKPEVMAAKKKIHPQIRAGENIPFSLIVYNPFVKGKLSFELEAYIRSLGKIYYANNIKELRHVLAKLQK